MREEYVAILWPPIHHRWQDIVKSMSMEGVEIKKVVKYLPLCKDEEGWEKFIVDCYISHEKVDNPSVNLGSKIEKIRKKYVFEHLDKCKKEIFIVIFEFSNSKKIVNLISKELGVDWDYTKERLEKNKTGLVERGYSHPLNLIKDIIRKRFYDDKDMPPYHKGIWAGRKRIIHAPQSYSGCSALLNFLLERPHRKFNMEKKDEC